MTLFYLDTSSIRALSSAELDGLHKRGARLFASPYAFWEILCHLDEREKFGTYKSMLLRFQKVRVLSDPRAMFGIVTESDNRVPDYELTDAILAQLEKSSSLKQFYDREVFDSKGQYRNISDSADRARTALDREQRSFTVLLSKVINHLISEGSCRTDEEVHRAIVSLLEGDVLTAEENTKIANRPLFMNHLYIYYAYVVHLARRYIGDLPSRITEHEISPNDHEDALLCKHVALDTGGTIVTGDKKMYGLLTDSIGFLKRMAPLEGPLQLRVVCTDEIRRLVGDFC